MREKLNNLIAESEAHRRLAHPDLAMPRIGEGHAGFYGGIFSLMQDPGGTVHTPSSGAVDSGFVGIDNEGPTAIWRKKLFQRLEIPKCAVTPWNAFGAYKEHPSIKAIKENLPLCQQLLDTALPVAVVAQGRWAQEMAGRLCFAGKIFRVPHPSPRGRASSENADDDIAEAFLEAFKLMSGV